MSRGRVYPSSTIQELGDMKPTLKSSTYKPLQVHNARLDWILDGFHVHWGKVVGKWNVTKPQEKELPPTTLYNQPHLLKTPSHE